MKALIIISGQILLNDMNVYLDNIMSVKNICDKKFKHYDIFLAFDDESNSKRFVKFFSDHELYNEKNIVFFENQEHKNINNHMLNLQKLYKKLYYFTELKYDIVLRTRIDIRICELDWDNGDFIGFNWFGYSDNLFVCNMSVYRMLLNQINRNEWCPEAAIKTVVDENKIKFSTFSKMKFLLIKPDNMDDYINSVGIRTWTLDYSKHDTINNHTFELERISFETFRTLNGYDK